MTPPAKAAVPLGLTHLYHYQDFQLYTPEDHFGRFRDILTNHRIWCSNPATFNDPWDGKPYFDPALLDDPAACSATAEELIASRTGGDELNHIDEKLRTDPAFLKEAVHRFSTDFFEFITKRWAVYCLTLDPCITLMWSHYARNHKGICLEFAVPNTKFERARHVHYQKEYPKFLLHDEESRSEILLFKSDDWQYEHEYRLICPHFTEVKDYPLTLENHYLQIEPSALTSVILGCQMEYDAATKIEALVEQHAPYVRVRRAKRALNQYRLEIEDFKTTR